MEKIGNWIKELRRKQNLKKEHYAKIIDSSLEEFILIESDKKEITLNQLNKILRFAGINREDVNKNIQELKITQFHVDGNFDEAIENVINLNLFVDNFKKVIELNEKK